ncbi:MAG: PAS domain S-box protein [Desulfobacterales bacterium]|uniref:histidine kinase n=1 Tax=Candidatus Desulfatibia vada TaxID=2841696 RepID=A0A8J6P045_9BACT|nr:PAS domain S-box protein [Candidatus Desulfatibia vada]MBL6971734.1 PAS domain S-box protein [Desulfobacterales bacterium]
MEKAEQNPIDYRRILNLSLDLICIAGMDGYFKYVNPTWGKILGYTREELLSRPFLDFIHPDDHAKNDEEVAKMAAGHQVIDFENRYIHKDGFIRYISWTAQPVADEKEMYCIGRDITKRKRAEEALQQNEARYKALFNNMNSGVAVYKAESDGEDFFFVDFNKAGEKIDAVIKEELIGKSVLEAFPSIRDFGLFDVFQRVWRTGKPEHYPIAMYKDERVQGWRNNFVYKLPTDEIVAVYSDETQRKQAEEALRESEEQLKKILDHLPAGVVIIDAETHAIVSANPVALQLISAPEEKVVGSACHRYICPAKEGECPITDLGQTVDSSEKILLKADGQKKFILKSVSKIMLKGKEYLLETFIDISDRKKLETQLRQAQKMESIGTLAGGIAHDFNNILFPIMGFAEMALDDVPKNSPLHHNIKEIILGTKRASDLVKQILAFSRQSDQKPKPLKVQLIIKEVLKLMRSSIPTTIKIKHDINNECGLVMADTTQVHQVAMNLMTNAYHVMEDEGGVLSVSLKEVELTADDLTDQSIDPGTYVCLTVTDTGSGIDQSVISSIFEPYFTTKGNDKGTGLGLAVVHGIVKNYRGDIKVYSEPGKGTAFHVYLPVIKFQTETEETGAVEPVPKGTERILLVDDEEPIVRMEKQMLERLGYHVTERTSSVEALEAFRVNPNKFDLVITDMTMPNTTGVQLAQKLLEIRPDIPIILCTGFSTKVDKEKAAAFGIRGYVMKPVVMSELAKKIREVLEKY